MRYMDLDWSEVSHHSGTGFWGMISDNAALYNRQDAHRLNAWGGLVAMVVRSAGLRGYGEDRSIGVRRSPTGYRDGRDSSLSSQTLSHPFHSIKFWAAAACVENKGTTTYTPGLTLCSRSIGPSSSHSLLVGCLETHLLCYVVIRTHGAYKCVGILRLDQGDIHRSYFTSRGFMENCFCSAKFSQEHTLTTTNSTT